MDMFYHMTSKYMLALRRFPHTIKYLTLKPNSLGETNSLATQSVDLWTFFPI